MQDRREGSPGNGGNEFEALRNQVQGQTVDQVKASFLSVEPQANELKQLVDTSLIEMARGARQTILPFEGDPADRQSQKGKAKDVKTEVIRILFAGQTPDKIPTPENRPPEVVGLAKIIIQQLSTGRYSILPSEVTDQSAPYLYNFFNRVISGEINDLDSLTRAYQQVAQLQIVSPVIFDKLSNSLIALARNQGIPEAELQRRFGQRERGENPREQQDPTTEMLLQRLGEEDKKFFECLGSAETFKNYCLALRNEVQRGFENDLNNLRFQNATPEEREKMIARDLTMELKDRISSVVYKIYEPILTGPRNKPLEELETERGTYYANVRYFLNTVDNRLVNLKTKISEQPHDFARLKFILPKRESKELYDFEKNKSEGMIERVLPNFDEYSIEPRELIEFLRLNTESEAERLRFGFDLEVFIRSGQIDPEKGTFGTIADWAGRIKTSMIDEIFADRSGEMIQEAISLIDFQNENQFVKNSWQNDPTNGSEYFSHLNKMSKIVEEFIRERYSDREQWLIDRAIFNAKLVMYGVFFKPFHLSSYADPFLNPGPTVAGQLGLTPFNPTILGMRFPFEEKGKELMTELLLKGVDFMPINYILKKYNFRDYKEFYQAWKDSIKDEDNMSRGKAAFYPHFGADYRIVKLFIDIGNIDKVAAGGIDRISSWRLFLAYEDWIRDCIDSSDKIKYLNPDKTNRETVLVEGWKRLENIGIDALENYAKKFIIEAVPKQGKLIEANKLPALKNLFGYLYDRYFDNTEMGKKFRETEGINNKAQFIEKIEGVLTNKVWTKREKDDEINGWIYKAFTVLMYERVPLKFVLLEKPRMTQNGVTLRSQLQEYATSNWGGGEKALKKFEEGINDLGIAQARLRTLVDVSMEEVRDRIKRETHGKDDRNLFGDLSPTALISAVNEGKGYILDERMIRKILGDYLQNKPDMAGRVDRAVALYKKLSTQLTNKLPIAEWERGIEGKLERENDPKKKKILEKLREWVNHRDELTVTRLERFWELYYKDEFGMSITSGELGMKFLNFSSTGPDTIKRACVYNHDTADNIVKLWGEQRNILKQVAEKKDWHPLYEEILKVFKGVELQSGSGEPPQEVAQRFLQRAIYFFRDESAETINPLEGIGKWAIRKSSSFSEEDAGGPGKAGVYKLGPNEIVKVISQFAGDFGRALILDHPIEANFKTVKLSDESKFWGGIVERLADKLGKPEWKTKRVRDYANELSTKALKQVNKANPLEYIKNYAAGRIAMILLMIALILGWKAFKEDFQVGAKK